MASTSINSFSKRLIGLLPRLCRASMKFEQNALSSGDITIPQYWTLERLRQNGPMPMRELASYLQMKSPTATILADRLHEKGYIRRESDEHDRRVVLISLTAKGRKALEEVAEQRLKGITHTFSRLSADERANYLDLIEKLVSRLDATTESTDTTS